MTRPITLLVRAGRDLPVRSVEQHDHVGRGAAVAGLQRRPAASYGLRRVQRAVRLSRDLLRHAVGVYRYNNGYIYQVDPTTMLVTAIVASI
jgi:hypothetical protein